MNSTLLINHQALMQDLDGFREAFHESGRFHHLVVPELIEAEDSLIPDNDRKECRWQSDVPESVVQSLRWPEALRWFCMEIQSGSFIKFLQELTGLEALLGDVIHHHNPVLSNPRQLHEFGAPEDRSGWNRRLQLLLPLTATTLHLCCEDVSVDINRGDCLLMETGQAMPHKLHITGSADDFVIMGMSYYQLQSST